MSLAAPAIPARPDVLTTPLDVVEYAPRSRGGCTAKERPP